MLAAQGRSPSPSYTRLHRLEAAGGAAQKRPLRERYPIPSALNSVLVMVQVGVSFLLLALGARAASAAAFVAYAVAFAFVMQMGFSLLHEAVHDKLHRNRAVNDAFGLLLAAMFPGSYQVLKVAHLAHHRRNRSDAELLDYIRPGESPLVKRIQYYGLNGGLTWLGVPFLCVALSLVPVRLLERGARGAGKDEAGAQPSGAAAYLAFMSDAGPWRVRAETALTAAFLYGMYALLKLDLRTMLAFYAAFGFSWSSQQYVYHVRSPRHLVEGAFNLRLWRPIQMLYLNLNYHLTHHRGARIPWIHLPAATEEPLTRGYFATYCDVWLRGPEHVERAWPVEFQATGPVPPRA